MKYHHKNLKLRKFKSNNLKKIVKIIIKFPKIYYVFSELRTILIKINKQKINIHFHHISPEKITLMLQE